MSRLRNRTRLDATPGAGRDVVPIAHWSQCPAVMTVWLSGRAVLLGPCGRRSARRRSWRVGDGGCGYAPPAPGVRISAEPRIAANAIAVRTLRAIAEPFPRRCHGPPLAPEVGSVPRRNVPGHSPRRARASVIGFVGGGRRYRVPTIAKAGSTGLAQTRCASTLAPTPRSGIPQCG
jgi:hypothetical protein